MRFLSGSNSLKGDSGPNGPKTFLSLEMSGKVLKALKVVDADREVRLGLVASSISDLEERVRDRLRIRTNENIRIVLEADGTEIDENDYFATLEPDTALMILCENERWTPYKSILTLGVEGEEEGDFVWRLDEDLSYFPWISGVEMERLGSMGRAEMERVISDGQFVDFLVDLKERVAEGGRDILHDPIRLIRLYSQSRHFKGHPPPRPPHTSNQRTN